MAHKQYINKLIKLIIDLKKKRKRKSETVILSYGFTVTTYYFFLLNLSGMLVYFEKLSKHAYACADTAQ